MSQFDLSHIYAQAIELTLNACEQIQQQNIQQAAVLLQQRKLLVRDIYKNCTHAPLFSSSFLEEQAILFIKVDRELQILLSQHPLIPKNELE